MRLFLFVALSLNAATAVAQAPAEAPKAAAEPDKPAATPAAEPRRPLILRLDEIDGAKPTFAPSESEKTRSGDLPSLGGDARTLERAKSLRSSPYPHSSENLP
jgi:hypothetical protein